MGNLRRFTFGKMKGNPNAVAFLSAAGITDATAVEAINYLVDNLMSSGLWNKYYAIFPFVGVNMFQHSWDLKRPNNGDRLNFINDPNATFNNSGYLTGAATDVTSYAFTNVIPSLHQTLNSQNMVAAFGLLNKQFSCGVNDDNVNRSQIFINPSEVGSQVNTYIPMPTNEPTNGVISANKLASGQSLYRNGVLRGSAINGGGLAINTIAIGATKIGAVSIDVFSDQRFQFFGIGQGLTDTEALTEYNIISQYNNILGRKTW